MARQATLLKSLLRERHWQKYTTMCRQYDAAARTVDATLVGTWPSRGQLSRWLAGDLKGLPHPDHCRVLEAMFPDFTARQLFARSEPEPLPPATIAPTAVATADISAFSPSSADMLSKDPVRRIFEGRPIPAGTMTAEMTPSATGRGAWGALHEEMAMATEESARFVRRARGAIGREVLDQLDADVRQLAAEYLRRPPHTLFSDLNQLRGDVFSMLRDQQLPAVLPRLYQVGGRLCALLAHACFDLGQMHAAQTHARSAWVCAELAGDDSTRVYVRWVESNVAYWNKDYAQAAQIAESARRYATSGSSLLRLASQEARAYAARGDANAVEKALATATDTRDLATEHDRVTDGGGVLHFDAGKAAYYASEARLALGGAANVRQATLDAQQALELFAAVPHEERCQEFVAAARLDLAAAHLANGDLDGAQTVLRDILNLPVENRTVPVVRRMAATAATIAGPRFVASTLGGELTEQLGDFCNATAVRELPSAPG